jgi:nucleotide-binding universal stress UspA family protein
VVGLDGSAASRAALEWACRSAGPGEVIHAVHVGRAGEAAQGEIDTWVAAAATGDAVVLTSAITDDRAAGLLRFASDIDAGLLAIGRHTPRRIGRMASALLKVTTVPIAIVGENTPVGTTHTVVAGIGRGAATRAALRWAAAYADTHHTGLHLIRAVPNRPAFRRNGLLDVMAWYIDPAMAREWASVDLEAAADAIDDAGDSTHVPISWSAVDGSPGPVLVDAGAHADLLVVGLHDDNEPPTADHDVPHWLHHTLTHAPCPVVIVPADATAGD